MEKIQKIKLMMGYDLSKTLNENVESLDIIIENETNINEQGTATVAKDLESAFKADAKDIAKINSGLVNSGVKMVGADGKTLVNVKSLSELESAIKDNKITPINVGTARTSIINSLDRSSKLYSEMTDNLISKGAFYQKYKGLPEKEIATKLNNIYPNKASDIAKKFKEKEASGFYKDIDKNAGEVKPTQTGTPTTAADAVSKDATSTTQTAQGITINVNGNANSIVIGDANKVTSIKGGRVANDAAGLDANVAALQKDANIKPDIKNKVKKNVTKTKKISRLDRFTERAKKIFNRKWLYALGIIGGGYFILKWLFGGTTNPDIPEWSECMTDMINNGGDNVDIKATSAGDPVVAVKKSERYPELDAVGGLWFFSTGRVMSADKGLTKRGTWSCPGGKMQVAEDTTLNEDALGNIEITWDGQPTKKTTTGGGGTTKTSMYKNCTDFPFTFGCKNEKITEIQKCLGMEEKYQTGNFGPITKAKLIEKEINDGTSITQEDYNKIMASCGGSEEQQTKVNLKPGQEPTIEPTIKKVGEPTAPQTISPDIKPADIKPAENGDKGKAIFDMLKSNYNDGVNPENPYIFTEGDRLKYKGIGLDQSVLDQLSKYIMSLGYHFIKDKPKEDYGHKYVWEKN
jgi:hypothetical protein